MTAARHPPLLKSKHPSAVVSKGARVLSSTSYVGIESGFYRQRSVCCQEQNSTSPLRDSMHEQ